MPPISNRLNDAKNRFKLELVANPKAELTKFCQMYCELYGYSQWRSMYGSMQKHFMDQVKVRGLVAPPTEIGRRERLLKKYAVRKAS